MTANQTLGALAIVLAGGCFALAWRAARAGRPRRALGLILAGGPGPEFAGVARDDLAEGADELQQLVELRRLVTPGPVGDRLE